MVMVQAKDGTVNNMLALDFNTAIPGHGEIMNRRDVLNFRNQMESIRARMTSLIRDGVLVMLPTNY